jgi:chemotaxis methyl-accepting protein methylase
LTPVDPTEVAVLYAAELLHLHLGMRPDTALLGRLRRCVRDEAALRGQHPVAYVGTLPLDGSARQSLFDRVTVQETSFFRHPGQFDVLARHVLPELTLPVTIWSAGCANGQEAYSLAMVLDEQGTEGSVIATDVSTRALARTAAARYRSNELGGLSAARRSRHLIGGPNEYEIRPITKSRVTAKRHNLVTDPLPAHLSRCQVVFCRNVLIYFSPAQATAFLTRLAAALPAGACLFLGYAETIWQVTDLFEPVRVGDAFEYHRRRGPATGATRAAPKRAMPSATPVAARRAGSAAGRSPRRSSATKRSAARPTSSEQTADPAAIGQRAMAGGDFPAAIAAFRKCVYLEPDDPMGYVHLGFALEASGDRASAAHAFQAARSAIDRTTPGDVLVALGGYHVSELVGLLDSKRDNP